MNRGNLDDSERLGQEMVVWIEIACLVAGMAYADSRLRHSTFQRIFSQAEKQLVGLDLR